MNFITKLKNFWRNRNVKALPEAQLQNTKNMNNNKDKKWIFPNTNYNQPTKLDREVDGFLQAYSRKIEEIDVNQSVNCYNIAYKALVNMNGKNVTQEEYYNNYYKEQELLNQLYTNNQHTIQIQGKKDNPAFYHIKSKNYQMPQFSDMRRVYVNCNNANIAELSKAILDNNTNPNFYMKFTSNMSNMKNSRGEKIVIYCNENELEYTIQLLQYIKNNRPDLFKESENTLPFLQSVNGIASVSKQPETSQYIGLYGKTKNIAQSTNCFLANILEESYMEAAREIARCDPNISFLIQNEHINDEFLYMKNYPYINHNYHDYLIKSMEAKMEVLSRKNNLYIDGLYQQNNQDFDRNNNQYYGIDGRE